MDYNKIIIVLVFLLVVVIAGGVFFIFNNNASSNNSTINSTNNISIPASNNSSNISVEHVNTEDAARQSTSNTHLVMGQDGYYYIMDDNGNILENLGPSKKHYPNNPAAVDYPDAESAYPYMQRKL